MKMNNDVNADLTRYLADCGAKYDPAQAMLAEPYAAPGYHSKVASGTRVHKIRESLLYALALLQAGGESRRSADILRKIVSLQDTDPFSQTYGIWSWLLEEPVTQMDPPDWNWADFGGACLAQILADHAAALPPDLVGPIRASLGHAAWCIFRRNVRLEYTNIAILGGGVTAAAGELLGEPRLLDFGRERLRRIVELLRYHGSFTEYNSPTYTMAALEEPERILHIVRDAPTREAAEQLRQAGWQVIAEHFHPATQQWAGPHARAYRNHLPPHVVRYLAAQTGAPLAPHPSVAGAAAETSLVPSLPCPPQWRQRFHRLPEPELEIRRRFIRREDPDAKPPSPFSSDTLVNIYRHQHRTPLHSYGDREGITWMSNDAALGSVNHEDLWNQRRALIGYWKTAEDPAVCLRLRFLHDGHDFASAFVRNQQRGPRVLSAITMVTDLGDSHLVFDHPKDDLFRAEDFRLRYELSGQGVRVERLDDARYTLVGGENQAVIHAAAGTFGSHEVTWEHGQEDGRVFVDAVCYRGRSAGFDLAAMGQVRLAAGLELLGPGQRAAGEPPRMSDVDPMTYEAAWSGLTLRVPAGADAYPT